MQRMSQGNWYSLFMVAPHSAQPALQRQSSMNKAPGLSIIICTWNRPASLRATLLSLNAQTTDSSHAVEVVVVDNNSTDETKNVVEDLMPAWRFGTLRYVFEPRQGKQFALNHGIRSSTHDLLAFSDDDILFADNWACEIVRIFADETIDLVGGKTLSPWPAAGQPVWYHPSMGAILGVVDLGDERQSPPPPGYAPAGANMVVRRRLMERIGTFSPEHFRHMDYEFGMRSVRLHATVAYEPDLLVYAPVDNACLNKRYFRRWSFKAGIFRESEKTAAMPAFLAVPRWVYRQLLEDLFYLLLRSAGSSAAENFSRELRLWRGIGKISSRWHEKLQPEKHARWVEKYAQKKKNVY